ncbi:MAG TPA: DUF2723 domain-containing protein, partial [Anaerolineae bacterium]|nr:DUF2723 domain-containing protein [Anaerolineae bacterium]
MRDRGKAKDSVWDRVADAVAATGLFIAALALYLSTLAPTVAALYDDSLEFPLVAHRLAIAHPTGYPFYTLLAALLARGPWANPAWGVNLLSAVAAALSVALVYLVARALTVRRLAALLGAVALAASPVFWSQAVIAEVYTLNLALVAALLWLILLWARRPFLPVTPFARLLVPPRRPGPLFLPGRERPAAQGWEALKARAFLPPHRPGSLFAPGQTRGRRALDRARYHLPGTARRLESLADITSRAVRHAQWRVRHLYRRAFPAVPPKARLRPHPSLYLLVLLMGLALAHHRTAILLAPALFAFLLAVEQRVLTRAALLGPEHHERPRWLQVAARPIGLLIFSLLAPLSLYLYLPLRGEVGSLDGTYEHTLAGFWSWVTASGYSAFFADNPLARDLDPAFYANLFWDQFGPAGLALAITGLVALLLRFRRPEPARWEWLLTGLAFITYVAVAVLYRVPDVE